MGHAWLPPQPQSRACCAQARKLMVALGRGDSRNAGVGAAPACARASGHAWGTPVTPWCTPPAAPRARQSPRAPCAREEDEFVVDLAGVTGDTRGRRRLATARGPRGRSWACPSVAGARLAAPATAVTRSQRARQHFRPQLCKR
jgi:hypothetical protein